MTVFAVCILSLIYLAVAFLTFPTEISSTSQFNSLEANSFVSIEGVPNETSLGKDYTSIKLKEINVRATNVRLEKNISVTIEGYKSSYLNRSWIQATKIEYDN
jgi:hypothetical protein